MKILGISAGTRNGRNDSICKEALLGAKEAGAEVEFIHLYDLDIKYCTGCNSCVRQMMSGKGNTCVVKDDFNWLMNEMLEADGILISAPIFEKGAPAIFHSLMDRFGPRTDKGMVIAATEIAKKTGGMAPDPRYLKNKVISYIGIGGSDWMTRVQCDFSIHAMSPAWKVIDNEAFSWSGAILVEEERIKRAHEIGSNIANAARDIENAAYKGESGLCPHCHCREFYFKPEGTVTCCNCGIEGKIEIQDNTYRFVFADEQLRHAHDSLEGKFIHCDDINVNTEKAMQLMNTPEYREKIAYYQNVITAKKPH